jgi:tetratricopeptide (TPR) repeat protein
MATVYLARDIKLNRPVAIKVLRPELSDLLGRERFLREVEIAAGLQHPNIVPLYDSGSAGGLLYYVMRLVEGESLRDRLDREKQLPLEDALQVTREVAEALSYAHSLGIVHRDIKPANILLSGGHALVADFGVARAITVAGGEQLTERGIAIGTPAYMSPEQASGQDPIDGRSDVYALGCTLYEMLAGDPPFSGRTVQAVIARHQQERPPSLRVVRPTVSLGVQRVIETALAKVPADRYTTATLFVTALEAARFGRVERKRLLVRVVVFGLALGGAWALWRMIAPPPNLDSNSVLVLPLGETPPQSTQEGVGVIVSLMIGTALEYTEPLRWIDGLPLLNANQQRDVAAIGAAEARRIARSQRARWYLDGTVVRRGDSVTVILRLNDAKGDSVVARVSASRVAPEAAQAGLLAVNQLLPRLLAPGWRVDLSALAERRPAAVASWLQAEREYRRSNFRSALEYLHRSVEEDSAMAVAALRGAQAASWVSEWREATAFVEIALRYRSLLPRRLAEFAEGIAAYLAGQGDSAVQWLTRALATSPDWTEAHYALGEVYYHLLPSATGPLDSLAEAEFAAAAIDTGFSPPRFHLAEIAIRSGDPQRADQAVQQFIRFGPDTSDRAELALGLQCVRGGRDAVDWRRVASAAPLDVVRAAKMLAAAGAIPSCAEDGFRAVFDNPATPLAYRWGAFLGLQGVLAGEGRISEIRPLVDSAVASGLDLASHVYLLDALAGVGGRKEAEDVAGRLRREGGEGAAQAFTFTPWLIGEWGAEQGDQSVLDSLRTSLVAQAERSGDTRRRRFAEALTARLALLRRDTATAIAHLRAALPNGRRDILDWDLGEPLASDRLLLARLLLARGFPREALAAAAVFDHPAPIVFLPYLPASLAVRRRAALALGQSALARSFEARLARLGRRDVVAEDSSHPSGGAP